MPERILAIDDDAGMRRVFERALSPAYPVEVAASMAEARRSLEEADFDLVLVDIQLGDGDGYTLCREIKRDHGDTDVILITGSLSEPDEKLVRALGEGAFYFLFKPFERRVLRALVDRCFELRHARQAQAALTRELSSDLDRARRFQQSLIPRTATRYAGWHAEGRFEPCDALGGDFYLHADDTDEGMVVALSDVVGHGVRAAMYAGMLQSLLRTATRRDPEPRSVHRELLQGIDFFEAGSYASLVYCQLGPGGRIRYLNAGHPPPVRIRSGGRAEELETTARILMPLFPDDAPGVGEIELSVGERLFVFSDGMYEALDPGDRDWGRDGLIAALSRTAEASPAAALDEIMADLHRHAGERPLNDDATILLVERTG